MFGKDKNKKHETKKNPIQMKNMARSYFKTLITK